MKRFKQTDRFICNKQRGSGVAIILVFLFVTCTFFLISFRIVNNRFMESARTELGDAVRNGSNSALTCIDYTSVTGITGVSNSGDITMSDIVLGLPKSCRLDEPKALKSFYQTYTSNLQGHFGGEGLFKRAYNSIDKLIIIYPRIGQYEAYVFTPTGKSSNDVTPNDLVKNVVGLPTSEGEKVYSDHLKVRAIVNSSNKWYSTLKDIQNDINSKAESGECGSMKVFFSGTQEEYNSFVFGSNVTIDMPMSTLDYSAEPIFLAVIKDIKPNMLLGYSNNEEGLSYYEATISNILRKME